MSTHITDRCDKATPKKIGTTYITKPSNLSVEKFYAYFFGSTTIDPQVFCFYKTYGGFVISVTENPNFFASFLL